MRPSVTGEIIFEGILEARVAAELLVRAGESALVDQILPPVIPPSIGRREFMVLRDDELHNRDDTTDYICPADAAPLVLAAIETVANLSRPGRPSINRNRYMGQKIVEYRRKLDLIQQVIHLNPITVMIGEFVILGLPPEEVEVTLGRVERTREYLEERGWSARPLTYDEAFEVRCQPFWQV